MGDLSRRMLLSEKGRHQKPLISGQMVWESYPVIWIGLGLGMAILLFAFIIRYKMLIIY